MMQFTLINGSTVTTTLNYKPANYPTATELLIYLDVNGKNGPNRIGRDIFMLIYYLQGRLAGTVHPYSVNNLSREAILSDSHEFNCNKNRIGSRCAGLIIIDGWQIKKDYPW